MQRERSIAEAGDCALRAAARAGARGVRARASFRPGSRPAPAATPSDIHIPPFARWPYQPFSREAACRSRCANGAPSASRSSIPNTELPFDNERLEGLWQRVGEYWWLGLPMGGSAEQGLTGKHNQNGPCFRPSRTADYAWSAAFVDYVMRMAGAGRRFPYSPKPCRLHQRRPAQSLAESRRSLPSGRRHYAPQRGDLICMWRGRAGAFRRSAGRQVRQPLRHRRRDPGRAARCDRRQCRQFGRRCGTSRCAGRPAGRTGRQRSSTPITRGLSCCDSIRGGLAAASAPVSSSGRFGSEPIPKRSARR